MALTRRGFVRRLGHATAGTVTGTMLAARGFEDLMAAHAVGQDRPEIPRGMIRLGSNESPYGPGPHVVAAVERALHDEGNRYTRLPMLLTGRLASSLGVSGASVLVSAGSGDLLRASVLAFVDAGRPLVASTPTFEAPLRTAESLRLPLRLVPLTAALSNDLDRMAEQGKGAGLVYICNPDNPTGHLPCRRPPSSSLIDTLAATSPETVVLIDEAYFDCADDVSYGSVAALAAERRNARRGAHVLEDSRSRRACASGTPWRIPRRWSVSVPAWAVAWWRARRQPRRWPRSRTRRTSSGSRC